LDEALPLDREAAKQSAREALIESRWQTRRPIASKVTDSNGYEVLTVFLKDLLEG